MNHISFVLSHNDVKFHQKKKHTTLVVAYFDIKFPSLMNSLEIAINIT